MTRHRPMFRGVKMSESLYLEMSGGGWAQQEQPDLWKKLYTAANLTYDEVKEAREGVETTIIGIEAVKGGASLDFEQGARLNAALRSARSLLAKLDAYLKTNA